MNEDQKAKEKARQARKAGLAVASQRETAEDATARLDERISGQRSAAKDAKERAKRSSDPSSGLKELARMEADATAKARVRPSGGPAVRPGAFYVEETSAPPAAPEELSQMESDVMSKSRARPTASPSVADSSDIHSEIAQLEAQATGRSRRDEGRAKTDLNQLEADVAAKTRARGSAQTSSTVYQLSKLESDVMAKARVRPDHSGATKPGAQEARSVEDAMTNTGRTEPSDARNELNQLEADVARKQSARSSTQVSHPGVSNVRDLDERIAYKTGIPLNNEEKEQNPAEEETSSDQIHNVSKITGISPATVSEALEKTRALYQGADLSILENKLDGYQTSTGERYHDLEAGDEEDGKLAVAIAVNQDDEDKFIPAAVEYDPDSKPPLYKNRRFRLYSLLAFSLLSSVVIAGLVAILVRDDDPQKVVPTNERWNIGIQELLEKVVGNENLSDKSSSHYSALEWIIEEDPMQLTPDDDHLIQRYLLAHFYFDTHQEGNWLSCERQNQSDRDETCVFKRLKSVFPLEYNDVIMFRWLSLMHECEWAGIFCDDFEQVRAIDLTAQVIQGTLPVELSHLSFLQGISLGWNEFEGTIPSEYGNIKQLLELELHYNSLTGTIPSWPEARNLQLLNLGSNHLTGSLPSDMRYLSNLEGLYLNENGLTGTFPEEFAELSSLAYIRLNRNDLTGTLMTELGKLNPHELWFHRMPLTGTIPSEIGNMTGGTFADLRLSDTELKGTIPEELYNLSLLNRLDLYSSSFSGTISSRLGELTWLHTLRINDNSFTGTLPTEMATMDKLNFVWLQYNDFSGEVPRGVCDLKGGNVFGTLEDLTADCLPGSSGEPALACECCDICCDNEIKFCDA